ncbi:MAG: hypothetical protein J0I20_14325 [Chloroflexi bacterium]|nr:hypothetical protein [Chloroflexota bacterium]OJW02685.1 MAG: hypothetical protein BGO39_05475 [Chloroflexi bacterium 54-19]
MVKGLGKGLKNHRVLLSGIVVILLVAWFGFVPLARSFQNETRPVHEADWSYTVNIVGGKIEAVNVDVNFQSAADVEKYAQAMRRENLALFGTGVSEVTAVSIVFNQALSWQEADAFVKQKQIFAGGYDFRFVNKTDPTDRYTYGVGLVRDGKTGQGFADDKVRADFEANIANLYRDNLIFKGVIGMQVTLSRSDYLAVVADPRVYLVDMPGVIIKAKIANHAKPGFDGLETSSDFSIPNNSPQLYRQLEDFGLVKPA